MTPWTAACQASLSITNSRSLLKLTSIVLVMAIQPSHPPLSPFSSRLQSFPASGSFPMSEFFASGGQSIGASASTSVLPMNIQDCFLLGWTGWISLQSKGLSRGVTSEGAISQCRALHSDPWARVSMCLHVSARVSKSCRGILGLRTWHL